MAKIGVFDALTNENVITEIDDTELNAEAEAFALSEKERIGTQKDAKAAAEAKLAALGLTADDLKALGL
jgi:hypothetical protein